MKLVCSIVLAVWIAVPGLGFAAAPELKVSKSVIVHAPPASVWQRVRAFDGLASWNPEVSRSESIKGTANALGSERRITLASGVYWIEKLTAFDSKHHRFRVRMLEGSLPVSSYRSVLSIKGAGPNRSKVTWIGTFKRKEPVGNPAPAATDAAAIAAIGAFYDAGLENLRKVAVAK